jgi:predicted O-methyltransferase YrrM
MHITDPKIDKYVMSLLPCHDGVLKEMEVFAQRLEFPIIGPMVGPFLRQLALIMDAQNVFEMGSGFGYSAYWFAGGLKKGGKIVCTDTSEDNRRKALDFLGRSGFDSAIDFRVGDACDIIRRFDGPFDIILNDINKQDYPKAFDIAIPRLRKGGVFITDNVLWSGRIFGKRLDASSKAILEFNHKLFHSNGLLSSIVPIRDGLALAVKL